MKYKKPIKIKKRKKRSGISKKLFSYQETFINVFVFVAIFLFFLSYFKPNLILLNTTTSGGDTGSHNYPFWYLKYKLLPQGRIIGWSPGWYAGFPIFQFYFVLPFLLMVLLSYFLPIWVSFKIVTILGTFLLPITSFLSMKLMKFKFPTPILAAVFTLPFLFMEANSMWGGNIPSTLAGEFSYSISFAFSILFLGLLYRTVKEQTLKYWLSSSIIFSIVVLCHIYTAIFAAAASLFFFMGTSLKSFFKNFKKNFSIFFKIYFLAFLLSAFWTIPLFAKLEYATPYHYIWNSIKFNDVFPEILMPFGILAIFGVYISNNENRKDNRINYLLFAFITSFVLYKLSPILGFTDVRFIPFLQLLPTLIAAYTVSKLEIVKSGYRSLMIVIILILTIVWVQNHVTYIDFWIKWNYEGFQSKSHWQQLQSIMTFIRDLPVGRVVHEYSNSHDKFGTPRTFENMPLFSGKPTLEGLNIESALSSPYVFVIQAEISETQTCPIPGMVCGNFNIKSAEKHLELFNIRYIVATTDKLKSAIKSETTWSLIGKFGEIEVYEVGNVNYTQIPKYKPLIFRKRGTNWKDVSLQWFKDVDDIEVPILFVDKREVDNELDKSVIGPEILSADDVVRIAADYDCKIFSEDVRDDEIRIETDCINKPIIIKMSYFPNWKVEGADKIYLVSPSFMLIFPKQESIRLYYEYTLSDNIGMILTIVGISCVLFLVFRKIKFQKFRKHLS